MPSIKENGRKSMIIYLDTETTGLRPGNICQLTYVMQSGSSVTAKNFFFEVDSVEYGAYMVHGFSVEKLRSLSHGKRFLDHLDEISRDLSNADVIVAHNVQFDIMFLGAEFTNCGVDFCLNNAYCTMKKMTPVCKLPRTNGVGYKYPKLTELCSKFGVTEAVINRATVELFGATASYHDARFDTAALYVVCSLLMQDDGPMQELNRYL